MERSMRRLKLSRRFSRAAAASAPRQRPSRESQLPGSVSSLRAHLQGRAQFRSLPPIGPLFRLTGIG
jgi:hypothetical protein